MFRHELSEGQRSQMSSDLEEERVGSSRRWTVAVYLAGGENVSREMIPALHDMRDAALENRHSLRLLAQFEPDSKPPRLFAFDDELPSHFTVPATKRGRAPSTRGLANYEYVIDPIGQAGQGGAASASSSSSLKLLSDFVETGRSAAGDGPWMLAISGHASGAVGELLGHRERREPLYLHDLKSALAPKSSMKPERKMDILGMDCCSMSMVEVAFEVAPYARFLVASEGDILNHGWPYRTILDAIVDLEPEEAGAEIVRQFVSSYSDYAILDVPSHCAVCDLERVPLLTEPMRRLSQLLTSRIHEADVWRPAVLAHWEAQSYKDEEYVDLADFCDRLRMHIGDRDVQDACSDVIAAAARVVGASGFSGSAFQFSTGLSIYFPWCYDAVKAGRGASGLSDLESYQKLAFSRETLWGHFLEAYLWATRRAPRSELSGRQTREATLTVQKEDRMAFERVPSHKGEPARTKVKNHPSEDRSGERALPVRNMPPWNSRGTSGAPSSRLKNHPRKRD